MRTIFKTLPFLLFWLFLGQKAVAQHPVYYSINDENGLPSNEVYQIIQDDFGYIWIGCDAGLFRYDGFVFQAFTSESQYGHSMTGLKVDTKGQVWCRNFKGQIFRTDGDSLKLLWDHAQKGPANAYALDADGNAWVSGSERLELISDNGQILKSLDLGTGGNKGAVGGEICIFNKYVYSTHSRLGLLCINPASGEIVPLDVEDSREFAPINYLFFSSKGKLYAYSKDMQLVRNLVVQIIDRKVIRLNEFNYQPGIERFFKLGADLNGQAWLCTINGVFPCNGPNVQPAWDKGLFPGEQISNFIIDREGNCWFSSLQNGIFVVPTMDAVQMDAEHLAQAPPPITALTALPDGHLVAGTFAGDILIIDPVSKKAEIKFPKSKTMTVKQVRHTRNGLLISRGIMSMVNFATGKEHQMGQLNARDMVLAGDTLFVVSPTATIKIAYRDAKPSSFSFSAIILKQFGGWAMEYDSIHQTVWFALNNGLFSYHAGVMKEVFFKGQNVKANALSENNGIIWIGTQNEGLLGLVNGKVEYQFAPPVQLKGPLLKCIKAKNDCVYATSGEHLYKIYYQTGEVQTYGNSFGINPRDINAMDVVNGQLCLGTNKGILFLPADFKDQDQIAPNIRLSQVTLGGAPLGLVDGLELPYYNANFKIVFSSTCFRSRGKFTYRYRMMGLDSNWTSTPAASNAAVYASMPPGNYQFEVQALSGTGLQSKTAILKVHVNRPFWQKWWFYVLVGMGFSGIVFIFFLIRIRYLQRKAALQNQVTASHLTALKAQMNPHFMYNALNSIQDLVLQKDIQNANQYLSKFSNLMRKVLDASSNSFITIKEETDILKLYLELEKLRFGEQFGYQIDLSDDLDTETDKIPSMMVQPYVENALKHGLFHKKGDKKLEIGFKKEGQLICTIKDNGIGRKRAEEIKERKTLQHKSFATRANQKRFELIGKYYGYEIEVRTTDLFENGEAAGTLVEIFIPLDAGFSDGANRS